MIVITISEYTNDYGTQAKLNNTYVIERLLATLYWPVDIPSFCLKI